MLGCDSQTPRFDSCVMKLMPSEFLDMRAWPVVAALQPTFEEPRCVSVTGPCAPRFQNARRHWEDWPVSPQIKGTLKPLPGVLAVEDLAI